MRHTSPFCYSLWLVHAKCITHCALESGIKIKPPPLKISRKSACTNEAGDALLLCIVYHKMQMSQCWLHSYTNSYICLSFFVGENVHNIILSLNCFSVTEGQRWKPACECSFFLSSYWSLFIVKLISKCVFWYLKKRRNVFQQLEMCK